MTRHKASGAPAQPVVQTTALPVQCSHHTSSHNSRDPEAESAPGTSEDDDGDEDTTYESDTLEDGNQWKALFNQLKGKKVDGNPAYTYEEFARRMHRFFNPHLNWVYVLERGLDIHLDLVTDDDSGDADQAHNFFDSDGEEDEDGTGMDHEERQMYEQRHAESIAYIKDKDEQDSKKAFGKLCKRYPKLEGVDGLFELLLPRGELLEALGRLMNSAASAANSVDLHENKDYCIMYFQDELRASGMPLEPVLPFGAPLSARGLCHRGLSRWISAVELFNEFTANYDEMYDRVSVRGHKDAIRPDWDDIPAAFYADPSAAATSDDFFAGSYLQRPYLAQAYRLLYQGAASAASSKPGQAKTKAGKASKAHVDSATPRQLAYLHGLTRWNFNDRSNYGQRNVELLKYQFYREVDSLQKNVQCDEQRKWREATLSYYTSRAYGGSSEPAPVQRAPPRGYAKQRAKQAGSQPPTNASSTPKLTIVTSPKPSSHSVGSPRSPIEFANSPTPAANSGVGQDDAALASLGPEPPQAGSPSAPIELPPVSKPSQSSNGPTTNKRRLPDWYTERPEYKDALRDRALIATAAKGTESHDRKFLDMANDLSLRERGKPLSIFEEPEERRESQDPTGHSNEQDDFMGNGPNGGTLTPASSPSPAPIGTQRPSTITMISEPRAELIHIPPPPAASLPQKAPIAVKRKREDTSASAAPATSQQIEEKPPPPKKPRQTRQAVTHTAQPSTRTLRSRDDKGKAKADAPKPDVGNARQEAKAKAAGRANQASGSSGNKNSGGGKKNGGDDRGSGGKSKGNGSSKGNGRNRKHGGKP